MINSHNKTADIKAIENSDNIYTIKWNVAPIMDKDDDGNETATELSTYTMERYNYKPTPSIVMADIAKSGNTATLAELNTICEGLGAEPLEHLKTYLLALITDYDTSDAVNSFTLQGQSVWLDKDTRVGLMNSTTIAKNAGNTTTTLWFGGTKIEVDCDKAISLLSALELYALECYNVTAAHKAAVEALTSVEDVLAYDYKANYPEKLNMTL
jgi:hypothetical protein